MRKNVNIGERAAYDAERSEKTDNIENDALVFSPGSVEYEGATARLLSGLGLCVRARATVRGTELVCDALKSGTAALVVMACDASRNTAKRLHDRCAYYDVRLMVLPVTGERLAAACGRGGSMAAVGITDASMVKMIEKAALPLGI